MRPRRGINETMKRDLSDPIGGIMRPKSEANGALKGFERGFGQIERKL